MSAAMNDAEAIAAVRAGQRAVTSTTLTDFTVADDRCAHTRRVVACDGDHDVLECSRCGVQVVSRCYFDDEDYA